jgi:hypothetical protein
MASNPAKAAALGFSVHTGWAVVAAVCGPLTAPTLLHRGRIDIAPGDESGDVFHVAAELPAGKAQGHIDKCLKASRSAARSALTAALRTIGNKTKFVAAGVVANNARLPESLEAILASHKMVHSAEGDFYRRAILEASKGLDLNTTSVRSKELSEATSMALSIDPGALPDRLTAIGRAVGRPWSRDEKDAYCIACVALARSK